MQLPYNGWPYASDVQMIINATMLIDIIYFLLLCCTGMNNHANDHHPTYYVGPTEYQVLQVQAVVIKMTERKARH